MIIIAMINGVVFVILIAIIIIIMEVIITYILFKVTMSR